MRRLKVPDSKWWHSFWLVETPELLYYHIALPGVLRADFCCLLFLSGQSNLDPGPSLIVLVHLYYLQIGPICKYCHIKGKEYHIWMWRKHGSVQHVTSGEISAIVLMVSLHGTCLFLCLSSRSFFMIVFSNLNIHLSLISKSFCWFSQRCKICDLALTV